MAQMSQLVQTRDTDLEEGIARREAFLGNHRMRLLSAMAWTAAPLVIGAAMVVLWRVELANVWVGWIGMIVIAVAVLAAAGVFAQEMAASADNRSELSILQARLKALRKFDALTPSPDEAGPDADGGNDRSTDTYFNSLVTINVENLAAYYGLVKVHTDKSFRVAIAVGVAGFVLIVVGLAFGFADDASDQAVAYLATASGVVVEFIAGVFFYLYNRTVRQMKDYHDSLLAVQNILLSFKLVGDTKEETEKVKMVAQMLAYLVGRRTEPPASNGGEPAHALDKLPQL
jgi:hypothetical protein